MALWLSVDALILQAAVIDAGFISRLLQRLVDGVLPQLPQAPCAALLREPGHSLPRVDISIPDEDMNMRIELVLALMVDYCQPRGAALGNFVQISADEDLPLRGRKFERQRDHDLVNHTGVFAVLLLLSIQPVLNSLASGRQMLPHHHPGGAVASDIAGMGSGCARRVGAAPDAGVMQAENCHAASLAGPPNSTQTRREQTGQLSPTNRLNQGHFIRHATAGARAGLRHANP